MIPLKDHYKSNVIQELKDSLNLANQVAGLSTLKLGAGNAMPLLSDLG